MRKRFLMILTIIGLCLCACSNENNDNSASNSIDNEFLSTIEESITWRMENSGSTSESTLVNTELAYLSKYTDETFSDENLKTLADKYIEGLNIQDEALEQEKYCDYQILWQEGRVYRFEVLSDLYNSYSFMSDNAEFIGTYVSDLEYEQNLYKAYTTIEEDIDTQVPDLDYYLYDEYTIKFTLVNNTDYTFSSTFEINITDGDSTILENGEAYVDSVKPGQSYVVTYYATSDNLATSGGIEWTNYYTDVSW